MRRMFSGLQCSTRTARSCAENQSPSAQTILPGARREHALDFQRCVGMTCDILGRPGTRKAEPQGLCCSRLAAGKIPGWCAITRTCPGWIFWHTPTRYACPRSIAQKSHNPIQIRNRGTRKILMSFRAHGLQIVPDTWVTLSGICGRDANAVAGVLQDGRTAPICCPIARW